MNTISGDGFLQQSLLSAQLSVQGLLTEFALSEKFLPGIETVFGDNFNQLILDGFKQQWTKGNFDSFPEVEVRSRLELNGANGAFSAETNKIYLAREFLAGNDLDAVTDVLLEEYGHYIDSQINYSDTPGDEGAIFSALVRGEKLSNSQLQQLRNEDDRAVVIINGEEVAIEQAIDSFAPLEEHPIHNVYEDLARLHGNNSVYKTGWYKNDNQTGRYSYAVGETIQYQIDQIFDYPTHGFYAMGLVPINSTTEEETPILVIRGSENSDGFFDWYFNFDPNGIGKPQLSDAINNSNENGVSIYQWLNENNNSAVIGESLGGALAQGIAASYTSQGGNIGEVVTFSSPGINVSQVDDFKAENAGEVTHYITDGDLVALAGRKYLPGEWWLTDMESVLNPFERHTAKVLNPGYESKIAKQEKFSSTSDLNNGLFGYSDSDYTLLQTTIGVVASLLGLPALGITLAAGINNRETTEGLRQALGLSGNEAHKVIDKAIDLLESGGSILVDLLNGLAEAEENVRDWLEDKIFEPVVKGILAPLSEYAENFAENLTAISAAVNGAKETRREDFPRDRKTFAVEVDDGNLKINWDGSLSNTYLGEPNAEFAITSVEEDLIIKAPQFELEEVVAKEYKAVIEFNPLGGRVGGRWKEEKDIKEIIIHPNSLHIPVVDIQQIFIEGTNFNDRIFTTGEVTQPLIVSAKAGDDLIEGNSNADTLRGEAGNDILFGDAGSDLIYGDFDAIHQENIETFKQSVRNADYIITDVSEDKILFYTKNNGAIISSTYDIETGNIFSQTGRPSESEIPTPSGDSNLPENTVGISKDDTLFGGAGNDTLQGGEGNDHLYGEKDNDTLDGSEGADILHGGEGDDYLYGNLSFDDSGNDTLYGDQGNDELVGSAGNDELYGGEDNDVLRGFNGNDYLEGGFGNDELYGNEGDDTFIADSGEDTIDGGEGIDTVSYETIENSSNIGISIALDGRYIGNFDGIDGLDQILNVENVFGSQYSDRIIGNSVANRISGENGNDIIEGLGGDDIIEGNAGNDELYGNQGDDTFIGGSGEDTIDGGEGIDAVSYETIENSSNSGISIVLDGVDNFDRVLNVENVVGSRYGDEITGNNVANNIRGEQGNDNLIGGEGSDYLFGGDGNDTLTGSNPDELDSGFGEIDQLWGGDGADTFVIGDTAEPYYLDGGYAWIRDFDGFEGDRILVHGNTSDYSLNVVGSNIDLLYNDDVVASIDNALSLQVVDALTVTYSIGQKH